MKNKGITNRKVSAGALLFITFRRIGDRGSQDFVWGISFFV